MEKYYYNKCFGNYDTASKLYNFDATLTFEDEQTNAIRAHFEDYANANLEMMARWSDELTVLTNDGL